MKLGIWASSSPAPRSLFKDGMAQIQRYGWEPVMPAATRTYACRKESPARAYLAGPDQKKVEAFFELWSHPEIRDILGVRGGYGALRLLPWLEKLDLKKYPPKRLWGYSDLTVLQNYLYGRLGAPWVHSPFLTGPAFFNGNARELRMWKKILSPQVEEFEYPLQSWHVMEPGVIRAPLVGGNLASFVSLLSTRWAPRYKKPYLLFLEDLNEAPYRLDRLLHQLSGSPAFDRCRGVVLGQFTDCPHAKKILIAWAQEVECSLYSGIPAGHDRPNIPLSMGVDVILTAKKSKGVTLRVPIPKLG